jgi:hypothetical protein
MAHRNFARLLATALIVAAAGACGGDDGGQAEPSGQISSTQSADGNWFANPGLEEGDEPWISLHPQEGVGFTISQDVAHSGSNSALLSMRDPASAEGAKVYYLVQEIAPGEFPEVVRGYYRVENWQKNTPRQYLQFVVIAFAPDNFPTDSPNYQLRYLLAGADSTPFAIGNAYFVFVNREEPVQGEWVPFEARIKDDFQRLWGTVPEGFDKLRLLFEVRWDGKTAGDGPAEADVYYDDLYIGPAQ